MKQFSSVLATLSFSFLFNILGAQSQEPRRTCGTTAPPVEWDAWFNQKVEQYKAQQQSERAQPVSMTIPVVVHVIHGGQSVATFPNISAAQIRSQIKVLNDDYGARGFGIGDLALTGFSLVGAANTNITFCLAQFDPSGNALAEPGIDRVNFITKGWNDPASYGSANTFQTFMDNTVKPGTIWDPNFYFNIWVSDVATSAYLLGYATFPNGTGLTGLSSNLGNGNNDGIWVWGKAFGSVGSLDFTYNRGRTAVHETGHWLGLRHIGGDAVAAGGDCNATDYCNDTPPQKGTYGGGTNGQNFGSPTYPLHVNVCGSQYGDMFMNFMDYSDDAVLYLFTPNQNDRIQTAMQNGFLRNQLSASSATQCIGLPVVEFVENQQSCNLSTQPLDFTFTGNASTYTWTAEPTGVVFTPSANSASPTFSFPATGVYTISVITTNSIGTTSSQVLVNVNDCTGLMELANGSFVKLSPVPASDRILISYPDGGSSSEILRIRIVDALGREVIDTGLTGQESGKYELNVGDLQNGIYLVTLQRGESKLTQRLIISH